MAAPNLCNAWATTDDVCAPCVGADIDETILESALLAASEVLFGLTGRRYNGVCSDTFRPMRTQRMWTASVVRLPGYPVVSVDAVTIDGEAIDEANWKVIAHRWLTWVPTTGEARRAWPHRQRIELDPTEAGTFEVAYTWGQMPPPGGVRAAAAYGCQLAMACTPGLVGQCKLPQRVTSVTRQGISFVLLDPLTLIQDGATGLPEVDMWVAADRLGRARRGAAVVTPDVDNHVRTAGYGRYPPDLTGVGYQVSPADLQAWQ